MQLTLENLQSNPDLAKKILQHLSEEEATLLMHDWSFVGRQEQQPPTPNTWATWLYLAGRGAGKTRTGAEWTRLKIKQGFHRGGLIAPTASDVRDVMVEGESGLLATCHETDRTTNNLPLGRPTYESTKRRVTWPNGAQVALYSADEPERLRGPQHEFIWEDELAAWRRPETHDLAMFGLRLGPNPQTFISTTPKPRKILKDIINDPSTVITKGSTYSNRSNLAPKFFEQIIRKYEGTSLGKQELEGILLSEAEHALWTRDILDRSRVRTAPEDLSRVVIGLDPQGKKLRETNETGIIPCALGPERHAYVLEDLSGNYSPNEWARIAIDAYHRLKADSIVAEGNQGHDMVANTIHTIDRSVIVHTVYASRGKYARAEPVAAPFEKIPAQAHIVGSLPQLEDQLCEWEPDSGLPSPDRLDAMVWGLTACIVGKGITDTQQLKGFY